MRYKLISKIKAKYLFLQTCRGLSLKKYKHLVYIKDCLSAEKKKRPKDNEEEDATAGLDDPTPEPNISEVPLPKPGTIGKTTTLNALLRV